MTWRLSTWPPQSRSARIAVSQRRAPSFLGNVLLICLPPGTGLNRALQEPDGKRSIATAGNRSGPLVGAAFALVASTLTALRG